MEPGFAAVDKSLRNWNGRYVIYIWMCTCGDGGRLVRLVEREGGRESVGRRGKESGVRKEGSEERVG